MSAVQPQQRQPTSGLPRAGDLIGGAYRIAGQIGSGGMGAVFSATDERDGSKVALKWVRPGSDNARSRDRLMREWKLGRQVEHPNVVQILDAGEDNGSSYLVMELLEGESLESWVVRGPFDPGLAVDLLMPIARGVAAAHAVGIVHRDLKPNNVILCRVEGAWRPTVIDFGISRGAEAGVQGDQQLTQHGVMVGTPLYMAPEQLVGSQDADIRADVYALGMLLYELLSGEVPFESDLRSPDLLTEKIDRPAIPLSEFLLDVEPELDAIVSRALERSPDKRHSTVAELFGELERYTTSSFAEHDPCYRGPSPVENRGATLRVRRRKRRGSSKWLLALAAVLVVVVAVVGGLLLPFGEESESSPDVTTRAAVPPQPDPEVEASAPEAATDTATETETETETDPATETETETETETDTEPAAEPEPSAPANSVRPGRRRSQRRGLPVRLPRQESRRRGRSGSLSVDDF